MSEYIGLQIAYKHCAYFAVRPGRLSRDLEDYIHHFSGKIRNQDERVVGKVSGFLLRASWARNDGESLFRICDNEGSEECYIAEAIFDSSSNDFSSAVLKIDPELDYAFPCDVLVIQRIYIYKKFRRQGIARASVQQVIAQFGASCCLVVVQPWPMIFRNRIARANRTASVKTEPIGGIKRPTKMQKDQVRRFWSQIGFKNVGSKYMALPLEYGMAKG